MEDMKYNGFSAQPLESNEVKPLTQIPMEESVIEDRLISNEKGKEPEVVNEEENPKLVNAHKKRGRGRSLGSSNKINLLQVLASQGEFSLYKLLISSGIYFFILFDLVFFF